MSSNSTHPNDAISHYELIYRTYDRSYRSLKEIASQLFTLPSVPPLSPSSVVHDNACGTGFVAAELFKALPKSQWPHEVYASDASQGMIFKLWQHVADAWDWDGLKRVDYRLLDSRDLRGVEGWEGYEDGFYNRAGFEDGTFTHVFMNMGLFFINDAELATAEIHRTLQSGGVAIVTTWKVLGYVPMLQKVQQSVRPGGKAWEGPLPEEWMGKEKLVSTLVAGGFDTEDVEVLERATDIRLAEWKVVDFLNFVARSREMITEGWTEQETTTFEEQLKVELDEAIEKGDKLEMRAWVAVAKKR